MIWIELSRSFETTSVRDWNQLIADAITWLDQNEIRASTQFLPQKDWHYRRNFGFRTPADAVAFKLRWIGPRT